MDEKKPNVGRIDIVGLPALVFDLRKSMANMLRKEAGLDTNPEVAKKLRALAARFEVDQLNG
jgi:hypothetical protein